ncbi:MAG: hypothetical protein NTZ35_04370 [Ignavibacteriales bacterium]|nr:hypothetical protein [Ignavibacteriales bacterium]
MGSRFSIYPKFILFSLLAFAIVACDGWQHEKEKRTRRVILSASEMHEGWYFAAGDDVLIEGTVNGDAYVAGGVVEVNGTINGDLLVAGGQVTISGTVTDHIRAVGGTIRFSGKVGKDVSAAGGTVSFLRTSAVSGNILVGCGSLGVTGTIGKEARIASGDADLSGNIKGNVNFAGDYLAVRQGANIEGSVMARVREKEHVQIADGTVHGNVDVSLAEMQPVSHILGYSPWRFWVKTIWAVGLLLMGLLLVFLFPKFIKGIGSMITQRPGESLLWGFVGLIVIPILTVLLLVTIIGLPIGLLLLTLFLWILYLSQLSLGVVLGNRFFALEEKTGWSLFWKLALGVIIIQALTFIPYVRFFVNLASVIFGLGAILLMMKAGMQAYRET